MRRNIRERRERARAVPHLRSRPVHRGRRRRAGWCGCIDGFTTSDSYPYARHYRLGNQRRQLHAQQRQGGDRCLRRHGRVLRLRRRRSDHRRLPRACSRRSSRTRAAMPADLRAHVRYPELMLEMQALVYGLYHMTAPDVFYNREDLWTVATEVAAPTDGTDQTGSQPMEPNFVLMKLPGEQAHRVRRDPAVHPGQPQQSDRLDRGAQRRRRTTARRSSTTSRRPGWSTDRCRSRRASIRTRSSRGSCRSGTSRDHACGAARSS